MPSADNKFRLPEERSVYVVHGLLALFKNEKDTDYHLVITDESGKYSPGGSGTEGKETGTSFIAEIVDPDCTAGTQGDPAVHSVFETALRDARSKFEVKFPEGKGADSFLGIPVTVTGVAFYDRQHLQTGRAVNGLELHPVLDISFDGDSPVVTEPAVAGTEQITNPGFEDGANGWSGSTKAIGSYPEQDAHAGQQICWLLGYGFQKSEEVSQEVAIPAAAHSATLSFWIHIGTEETATSPYDFCMVQARRLPNGPTKTLATYSNLNETGDYVKKSFDLSAFIGSTVRIKFRATEDAAKATSFVVDDVSVVTN